MKIKIISIITVVCFGISSRTFAATNTSKMSSESPATLFSLPPFERAICCIKFYEGMHRKKDYPYVGYGHKLRPGERYSSNMSCIEAEVLLRKDLKQLCSMFSHYGRDSLLLATLAYNVGPYRLLGCKGKYSKSNLLKKIESGNRNIHQDYIQFCRWHGKRIPSIERRRHAELLLLYNKE